MWSYFDFLCSLTILLIILFTAVSYATGLFYLAELAEEQPTLTKRVLRGAILTLLTLHLLALPLSSLPWTSLLMGVLAQLSYYHLLSFFPDIPVPSLPFFLAVAAMIVSQCCWWYQIHPAYNAYQHYQYYQSSTRSGVYTSSQCLSLYLLLVWLVPLAFFVTASVSGQSLPHAARIKDDDTGKSKRGSRFSLVGIGRFFKRAPPLASQSLVDSHDSAHYTPAVQPHHHPQSASHSAPWFQSPTSPSVSSMQAWQPMPHTHTVPPSHAQSQPFVQTNGLDYQHSPASAATVLPSVHYPPTHAAVPVVRHRAYRE